MKLILILALFTTMQTAALTIDEPLEFETKVSVPLTHISCAPGPFLKQRLRISLPEPVGRSEQTGILISDFKSTADCSKAIANLKEQAIDGAVTLSAKVSQQTVIKLADGDRISCEGAQQEIVAIGVNDLRASGSVVAVEREVDCPAGIDPSLVQTKDRVIFVLHINGIPTAPKQ